MIHEQDRTFRKMFGLQPPSDRRRELFGRDELRRTRGPRARLNGSMEQRPRGLALTPHPRSQGLDLRDDVARSAPARAAARSPTLERRNPRPRHRRRLRRRPGLREEGHDYTEVAKVADDRPKVALRAGKTVHQVDSTGKLSPLDPPHPASRRCRRGSCAVHSARRFRARATSPPRWQPTATRRRLLRLPLRLRARQRRRPTGSCRRPARHHSRAQRRTRLRDYS